MRWGGSQPDADANAFSHTHAHAHADPHTYTYTYTYAHATHYANADPDPNTQAVYWSDRLCGIANRGPEAFDYVIQLMRLFDLGDGEINLHVANYRAAMKDARDRQDAVIQRLSDFTED